MKTLASICCLLALGATARAEGKKLVLEFTTLNLMHDKGLITQAEYDSAMHDLADSVGTQAGESTTLMLAKWSTTFYGFVEADLIGDTTQSFTDLPGNSAVARPGTFAGEHGRVTFSVRNSRLGFRLRAPEYHHVRASAQLEMDFLGTSGATTEAATFVNPVFRIRHMNLKLETPIVDLLIGQYWHLFGWQSLYHPNTVAIQGVPGQIYSRTIQLRVSKTLKTDPITVELALALMRPPQRDSATPEGQGGARLAVNKWTGLTTAGSTGTGIQPLSVGVSADVRHFEIPELSATPTRTLGKTGWAVAGNAFVPIISASKTRRSNALALLGEYAWGYGDADLYTQLSGGITIAPKLPNPDNVTPAPTYTADFDNGFVALNADGTAHLIQWQSWLVGLQYALPALNGRLWVSANASHITSNNARLHGAANAAEDGEWWADANLFWDATPAVRLAFEYSWFRWDYADGVRGINHRAHFAFFYLF